MSENRTFGAAMGTLWEGISIAWDAIVANKIRAGLTILGVGIGVSVVVIFAALITGVRTSISDAMTSAGPDNFQVVRFNFTGVQVETGNDRPPWWNRPEFEPREAERIAALPGVEDAFYQISLQVNVDFEGQSIPNIIAQGNDPGWPAFNDGDFVAGRDFTAAELSQARAVVVVSEPLAADLFGERDPIGRRVRVSSPWRNIQEEFRVVGVYEPAENPFSGIFKHWMVFPYTTARKRLKASDEQAQIYVVPREGYRTYEVHDQVIAALRSMRGLGPREENNFDILESRQLLEAFDRFTGIIFLVMLALSSAGLMVGGVGVVGIMLISVTERTREIGVRKALGATRREILWQFLVEAGVLTMFGAAAGLAMGGGAAYAVAEFTPIPARIPIWSIITALAAAGLTGMLFGILPAQRAAKMEPVEALRAE